MAVNRVLYATQTAVVWSGGTPVTGYTTRTGWICPTQTASADETIPQDDVLVLGKLGGIARLQKDVASCKASLKMYMVSAISERNTPSYWTSGLVQGKPLCPSTGSATLDNMLNSMVVAAQVGHTDNIQVSSNPTGIGSSAHDGFSLQGILTSIGIDASKGAFPMVDLAWEGVGRLDVLQMGTDSTLAATNGGDWSIESATPLTSKQVVPSGSTSGSTSLDTIASVKFSYDLPTESLSRLGGKILGTTSAVANDNKVFSKPPYKASMTADGQDLSAISSAWASSCQVVFNGVMYARINNSGLNISTRSFSQNVGDVGATYNVTAEGTLAEFGG